MGYWGRPEKGRRRKSKWQSCDTAPHKDAEPVSMGNRLHNFKHQSSVRTITTFPPPCSAIRTALTLAITAFDEGINTSPITNPIWPPPFEALALKPNPLLPRHGPRQIRRRLHKGRPQAPLGLYTHSCICRRRCSFIYPLPCRHRSVRTISKRRSKSSSMEATDLRWIPEATEEGGNH
jgi:hypothetical protein